MTKILPDSLSPATAFTDPHTFLRQGAFNHSMHASLIIAHGTGQILLANRAACKLLGYSKKELETLTSSKVFDMHEPGFKAMHREKKRHGSAIAYVTAIGKRGIRLPCEVSSCSFTGVDRMPIIVTSITDMRKVILRQKMLDKLQQKLVARDIATVKRKQKLIDTKKDQKVAKDISVALSKQKQANDRQLVLKEKQISDAREDARVTERSDIGKELHDNVNQLLGASRMYLEMGTKGGNNSQEYFNRSSEYMMTAIEEIRKLTRGLITDIIKNLGLCEGIENLCRDVMEITSLKISLDLQKFSESGADDKFKLNIFRIIQEQINNIIKHSGARTVQLSLSHKKNNVFLSITDDGIGFDTSSCREGVGIDNIRNRAGQYNGTVSLKSQPDKGCVLAIKFKPLQMQA